ncbi:MAG: CCA tRNA nucleotidyltransferase [Halobacteriovoraceae bacterium]|jgi:hypothetical protein|nr:CCA tRNA nucleotidyltransferase [Halobacteriovoraceae bacterium]
MQKLLDGVEFDPSFLKKLPTNILNALDEIMGLGVELSLVGGSVRDLILNDNLGNDLDIEWRPSKGQSFADLSSILENTLVEKYSGEILSFGVLRLIIDKYELELSPPRKEFYQENEFPYGHSDFKIEIDEALSVKEAFIRRDLTINAIGIKLGDKSKLIDPFNGLADLQNKLIAPCGPTFFNDPVRLLRAIRFRLKFNFEFSEELEIGLKNFNLSKLSHFYFLSEAMKGPDFFKHLKILFDIIDTQKIVPPKFYSDVQFFRDYFKLSESINNAESLLKILFSQDRVVSDDEIKWLNKSTGIKKSQILLLKKNGN